VVYDVIVIGGGAAGVFAAISAKQANPSASVALLEKSAVLLSKVKVSGGGRCNVTHGCFDPKALVKNYPRGAKELLGPFYQFQPRDTMEWFTSRGVALKIEGDGRVFPVSDSSQSIIDCLVEEMRKVGVEVHFRQKIGAVEKREDLFVVGQYECRRLILATGSGADGFSWAASFGHAIVPPVPSLFTFNVPTSPLKELSGIAIDPAEVRFGALSQTGPLLITHFGFSGPAALKLSAFAARELHACGYRGEVIVNWLPQMSEEEIFRKLTEIKEKAPHKTLMAENPFSFPKSFWRAVCDTEKRMADISLKELRKLAIRLHRDVFLIDGKTTHKEEFVTCGGVSLKEIDFKTMESRLCPGLYFAGEILDIDGVTGGFNFQNAWTTGYLAGSHSAVFQ